MFILNIHNSFIYNTNVFQFQLLLHDNLTLVLILALINIVVDPTNPNLWEIVVFVRGHITVSLHIINHRWRPSCVTALVCPAPHAGLSFKSLPATPPTSHMTHPPSAPLSRLWNPQLLVTKVIHGCHWDKSWSNGKDASFFFIYLRFHLHRHLELKWLFLPQEIIQRLK